MARFLATLIAVLGATAFAGSAGADAADWVWPVRGELLTAYDYQGEPYAAGQHRGIDVKAAMGAPVVAAVAGRVRFAGLVGDSGLTISVRTADGRFDTAYLHLSGISVRAGQAVEAGVRIGAVGSSGSPSVATPHLHFGVRVAGSERAYRDPLDFLPASPRGRDAPRGVPVAAPAPVRVAPRPEPVRSPGGARAPAPWPAPLPVAGAPGHRGALAGGVPGVDLGWALACVGLLLVVALTGAACPDVVPVSAAVRLAGRLRPSFDGRRVARQ